MSPSIRFHPSSRPTVETPLPSSPLWPCSSLSLLIFLKRRLSLSSTPFLSLPLCFPSFSSPTFSSRVLADSDLANPRDAGGGERRGWRGIENGRFHTRGEEGRTKETEHEGNGETKRLKGNRTSKRSTKRKKARKGERSLCVCVCGRAGQYSHRIENWARDNKPGLLFGTASFPFRWALLFFFNENSNYSYRNGNGVVTGKCTDLELFEGSDDRDTCTVIYLREFK